MDTDERDDLLGRLFAAMTAQLEDASALARKGRGSGRRYQARGTRGCGAARRGARWLLAEVAGALTASR